MYNRLVMHYCVVNGYNNKSQKNNGIKFYSLPLNNKTLLRKWLKVIPLKLGKGVHSRICNEHFPEKKRGRYDIPSIFPQ